MASRVAILFANLKGNIGDFAIFHAMLQDISMKYPGYDIDIFPHGYYDIDGDRYAAFASRCDIPFHLAGKTYFDEVRHGLREHLARSIGLWPKLQAQHISGLADRVAGDASKFADYEAIFIAGGEHWGGTKGGISMFGTLSAIHRHNTEIYAYPFSVNPRIVRFNSTGALRRYFDKIQRPLVVRDASSKKVLEKTGVSSLLGSDCVYSLHNVAKQIAPKDERNPSRIILAVTGSKRHFAPDLRAGLECLRGVDREITLLTTCAFEDEHHCAALAREFNIAYHAPLTWQDAVAEMKASALVVTNRLHGLILGVLAGVPLLPVTNRSKAKSFVLDANMPLSVENVSQVTPELLERCEANRDDIVERIIGHKAQVVKLAHSALEPIWSNKW